MLNITLERLSIYIILPAVLLLFYVLSKKVNRHLIWLSVLAALVLDCLCLRHAMGSDPGSAFIVLIIIGLHLVLAIGVSVILLLRNKKLDKAAPEQIESVKKKEKKVITVLTVIICVGTVLCLAPAVYDACQNKFEEYREIYNRSTFTSLTQIKQEDIQEIAWGEKSLWKESDLYTNGELTFFRELEYLTSEPDYTDSELTDTVRFILKDGNSIQFSHWDGSNTVFIVEYDGKIFSVGSSLPNYEVITTSPP